MMADEEIIRRRLLIDGDGTGDDRRLNVLLKSFIRWCTSEDESPEEVRLAYDRMLLQLAQSEFAMAKSRLSGATNAAELKNYESLHNRISEDIEEARREIESAKSDLLEARRVRKNRMEYDVLARVIASQPDRLSTGQRLEQLQQELNELQSQQAELDKKLEMRKKQFHVLVKTIHELQSMLEEPESDNSTMDTD